MKYPRRVYEVTIRYKRGRFKNAVVKPDYKKVLSCGIVHANSAREAIEHEWEMFKGGSTQRPLDYVIEARRIG